MRLSIVAATETHAPALASMRAAVADNLVGRFGPGHYSGSATERAALSDIKRSGVLLAKRGGRIIGALTLVTKKPWAIDRKFFTPVDRPLYLIDMAVAPDMQRQGVGSALVAKAKAVARDWPAGAIWLDAYDGPHGAAGFYARCGFRATGRATYRGTPLVYFEFLL